MLPTEHMEPVWDKEQEAVLWPGCGDACLGDWLFSNSFYLQCSPALDFLAKRTRDQPVTQTLLTRVPRLVNNRPFVIINSSTAEIAATASYRNVTPKCVRKKNSKSIFHVSCACKPPLKYATNETVAGNK